MFRFLTLLTTLSLFGCSTHPPMKTVDYVDIQRYMGDWYVIANIPTFIEKQAHNAVESYRLDKDGTVATTFRFRDGSFTGPVKTYEPTGFITNQQTNATWGMQFIWPIKSDFRIVYLDDDYRNTIIARQARDYVWIMSRQPEIDEASFKKMRDFVEQLGYDVSQLQRVPQRWPENYQGDA